MRRRHCDSRLQNHGNPVLSQSLRLQITPIRVEHHCEAVPTAPHVHCWHVCRTQQSCDQKRAAYFRRHPCVQMTIAAITVPCISMESGTKYDAVYHCILLNGLRRSQLVI